MIIFLRSTDGNPDSRLEKYTNFLTDKGIPFKVVCWDRNDKYNTTEKYTYFKKKAEYGSRTRNILNLLLFNIFLISQLYSHRKLYKTIHACDFDTILPAIFFKIFWKKKVIYDIFDWYIDSRSINNKILKRIVLFLERKAVRLSDVTVLCEEERIKQIPFEIYNLWILPNIPNLDKNYLNTIPNYYNNRTLKLSYVGILGRERGLEKILRVVEKNNTIELQIAGFGELKPIVESYAKRNQNISFEGSVDYVKGLEIMGKSDIILALYEKSNRNHLFAAPNKYYEGLFLGIPILTTSDTLVGMKTEKNDTGYIVNEDINNLVDFFSKTDFASTLKTKSMNARSLWENKFKDFIPFFFENRYLPFIVDQT